MKRKKLITVVLSMMLVVSTLAGCGEKGSSTGGEGTKKVKTLSLLMYTDWYKEGWKALEKYIDENSEELGFNLEISTIQGGEQGDQIIQTKFASDDLPDLIEVYKPMWMKAHCNGTDKLVDLSDLESVSEYDDDMLRGTYYDGEKLCGMPIDTVTLSNAVFFNKKIFEEHGIEEPKTWDEFLKVCEYFHKNTDITPVFYSGTDIWTLQMNACSSLFNDAAEAGGDISGLMNDINTNKKKYSDNEIFLNAIENSKELIDKGYVQESFMSDTYDNAQQAVVDGTAAMFINGTWFTDNIASKFPDNLEDMGVFLLPCENGEAYVDMYVPYTLCVTTQAGDTELAKKAVDFIASEKAQQIYADAQPGIYLNKNVSAELCSAVQELKDAVDEGQYMPNWLESNLYSFGNFGEYLADYYTGTYKEALDITKEMDAETERNAKAAGDGNWE